MQHLLYTVGLPGSGKSTWAKQFLVNNIDSKIKWQRVSRDDIRIMCRNTEFDIENENYITEVETLMVRSAIENGFNVLVDATHIDVKFRNKWHRLAQEFGDIVVIEKGFNVPLDICLKRNSQRNRHVPEDIIQKMYVRLCRAGINDFKCATYPKFQYLIEEKSHLVPDAIIVDIDGTIADNSHRDKYRTDLYHTDKPIWNVIECIKGLQAYSTQLLLLTARSESSRKITEDWLASCGLQDYKLYMRSDDDKRPDFIVKRDIFEKYIKKCYDIIGVFEDRPRNCRMWRQYGLTTYQLTDLEF